MADLAWFSGLFVPTLPFIAWHFDTASMIHSSQERKKHLGTFSVHVRLTVLELAPLERKKKEEEKERK